ncbi:MAG: hypothetical protein JL50_08720 [Peptococcaceae bacterium BICA1-7]|nr:MAG: hypothetical protein JL50_08720 [Peptococcaceae bacterium BICA1-7]HBV97353.1 TatD family deoxyribonuclease [Desulfotomaculum sp.]
MSSLIDTHFHLDFYPNHNIIYQNINKLRQYTLCVTNQPEIFESCIALYPTTQYLKFALGYNPKNIKDVKFNKKSFLNNIMKTEYIGEVGLDFVGKYKDNKSEQIDVFNFICEQSSKHCKLMSIHCNKAEKEVYSALKNSNNKKIILHWYNGNQFWLEKFLQLGCYFSINSSMMNSIKGKQLISNIPLDKLLIESDGPFSKIDGKVFTHDKLYRIYEDLERLIEKENIEKIIYSNFKKLLLI